MGNRRLLDYSRMIKVVFLSELYKKLHAINNYKIPVVDIYVYNKKHLVELSKIEMSIILNVLVCNFYFSISVYG